jgi:hypothetical protein
VRPRRKQEISIDLLAQANADRLLDYLKAPREQLALIEGTVIGGNDYNDWASSQGKKVPIYWRKCFHA